MNNRTVAAIDGSPCAGRPRCGQARPAQNRHAQAMPLRLAVLLVAVALLGLAPPVQAASATAASVMLEDLSSTELKARIAAGATTVLVPIGGTEQNGPHMALGKHNLRVKVLAARIAERLGQAVVAPVIAYVPEGAIDPATQHMRWVGTVSIPEAAFEAVLEGAARSFRQHGFRDVVFLTDRIVEVSVAAIGAHLRQRSPAAGGGATMAPAKH